MIRNSTSSHLEAPWLVLVNLNARNGTLAKLWPELKQKINQLLPHAQFATSRYVGDANDLVQKAVSTGIRHILAVGGDGTAHQVMNAIMAQEEVKSTAIVFALYPCGTGNDWVKTHQIPVKWSAWRKNFEQGNLNRQNLGEITFQLNGEKQTRYFMNVAGLAYDAFVVRATLKKSSFLPPRLFYFWSVLRCLFQYTPQAGELAFNGQKVSDRFYTINLGIGKYSGGGMQFVPHAQSDGDTMALTYVKAVSRLRVILNSYRFYEGKIATFKEAFLTQTQAMDIQPLTSEDILIEADGEFLGACPATIRLRPQALVFIGTDTRIK